MEKYRIVAVLNEIKQQGFTGIGNFLQVFLECMDPEVQVYVGSLNKL